ncbi:MAG: hypothetical protein CM1200mP30_08230 [Pseudomonadota bacterium]|nr:MAG: hypothetical protein CM1200mP30_08230 [Pseudomonadota bacterium]
MVKALGSLVKLCFESTLFAGWTFELSVNKATPKGCAFKAMLLKLSKVCHISAGQLTSGRISSFFFDGYKPGFGICRTLM